MTSGMFSILVKTSAKLAPSTKHQELLDSHFTTDDPKRWRTFKRALRSKQFAEAVSQDDRADPKLKRFAKMMSKHYTDKGSEQEVVGQTGKYTVKYHPDIDRYSCSCPDWAYTKSHKKGNKLVDCKHITQVRGLKNNESEKVANLFSSAVRTAGTKLKAEHAEDEAWKARMAANTVRKAFPKHATIMGRAAKAVLASM